MSAFDDAHERVKDLVARFDKGKDHYLSPGYQESELRNDFLNEFLTVLGWDVAHRLQTNPLEQDVKLERTVDTGGAQRRADYAFSIAPNFRDPRLVVEAKKPATELAGVDPYFQTVRYGWWKHIPLAGLTNFAEFHLLDCRFVPNPDTVLQRCVKRWHYTDYADREKFAELYWLVSREAVAGNMLEKFVKELPRPRGKLKQHRLIASGFKTVDESFLEKLDGHRNTLARSFKSRNPELDSEALTEITQRTVDRLVFMRFLEDKLIVPDHFVDKFGADGSTWADFVDKSRELDRTYNGTVFKEHAILDAPGFAVDDAAFAEVCTDLSHKNTLYDFNEIPIHILGSIYERFLANVIVATPKRVRVEPKPEVRKAGGVYYTPDYIVRYIVESTVGKLIDGKTPDEIAEMRFADIACGSGSFLLGVYDLLLGYHIRWYNAHPRKARKGDCVKKDGLLHLSLEKRRDILLNNLYGVDIDAQAVEVTQLSLYLKLLEEETLASARDYQLRIHAAILPPLNENIVCGNSIIGTDILEGRLFAPEEERKLNPMNFEDRFPDVMRRGGFDAIVGNPPYVNAWELYARSPSAREYLNDSARYATADRHWDLYVLFLERALQLVVPKGRVSFIIPYSYAIQKYAILSRQLLLKDHTVQSVADLRRIRVFHPVPVITIIPVISRTRPRKNHEVLIRRPTTDLQDATVSFEDAHSVPQSLLLAQHESMLRLDMSAPVRRLIEKVDARSILLEEVCYINYGAQMSSKEPGAFGKDHVIRSKKANQHCRPMISGRELYRYRIEWAGRFVDWSFAPRMYGPRWPAFFESPKLMIRDITGTHRIEATYDSDGFYCDHTVLCAQRKCDIRSVKEMSEEEVELSSKYDSRFLTGVVASRLLSAYYYYVLTGEGVRIGGGFHTYPHTIRKFPIAKLSLENPTDKARHDRMVKLVDQMLEAQQQRVAAKTDKDRDYYAHKCTGLDRHIDTLVYELYGLTAGEIRLVEGTE